MISLLIKIFALIKKGNQFPVASIHISVKPLSNVHFYDALEC